MRKHTDHIQKLSDGEKNEERGLDGSVLSRRETEACRHRLEKRWYRRLAVINILLVVVVCAAVIMHAGEYPKWAKQTWQRVQDELQDEVHSEAQMGIQDDTKQQSVGKGAAETENDKINEENREGSMDDAPLELQLLLYGIFLFVFVYLALYYFYAKVRSMSLRITEHNFPEVYALIRRYAVRLNMKQVPKAYVMQSNGVLNAFSSFLFRKQYIEINAEIFEVAYREFHDMDALGFVIAHEMAHIYYGHATLRYHLLIWFTMGFPLLGAIASRTREYSADRLAQKVSGTDGVEAMFMLMVDRHLYKMVDREDYLEEAAGQKGFFLWLVNLLADHPVLCKRIRALSQGEGSGELY